MACKAERAAVTEQQTLVNEIMSAVTATLNTLQSQTITLKKEIDILQTRVNTMRTCLGG
jgi:uncharacterized protein YlxW (UPF0749 family)